MAKKYPDITNWKNLNKYASMFKTSESGGKGQLLDGDPSYVTNDEALVKNLNLNYKVVVGGSEAGLIQSFRSAEKNKNPLLAYFYEPQWFFSEMKLVKVDLPPYKPGCDAVAAKVDCDYPPYKLNKLIPRSSPSPGRLPWTWSRTSRSPTTTRTGLDRHRPEQDDAGRRRQEVGGRQPGQGRRLAEVARGRPVRQRPTTALAVPG